MSIGRVAELLRAILKRLDDLDRRVSSMLMVGQIEKVEGDKGKVTFDEKDAATGKPFASPMLRWGNHSGAKEKGLARYSPHTKGETVLVLSPSGELNEHSRIFPWGPTDENKAPGEKPEDGEVITIGKSKIQVQGDKVTILNGNAVITFADGKIELAVGGKGFALDGDELRMTTRFRGKGGSKPAHFKGGKDSDGDTAVDGNDDVLV